MLAANELSLNLTSRQKQLMRRIQGSRGRTVATAAAGGEAAAGRPVRQMAKMRLTRPGPHRPRMKCGPCLF